MIAYIYQASFHEKFHVREHFAAVRAQEAEAAVAEFRRRPLAAEGGDRDRHRQVVVKSS